MRVGRALFDAAAERHGRVDLLVNNAGSFGTPHELDAVPLTEWQAVLAVNLTGVFLCTPGGVPRDARASRRRVGGSSTTGPCRRRSPDRGSGVHRVEARGDGPDEGHGAGRRPYGIACGQIDVGNAATDMTQAMAQGVRQADGSVRTEPRMDVLDVARAVAYMASLPLDANVASLTVHATQMPYVGRG